MLELAACTSDYSSHCIPIRNLRMSQHACLNPIANACELYRVTLCSWAITYSIKTEDVVFVFDIPHLCVKMLKVYQKRKSKHVLFLWVYALLNYLPNVYSCVTIDGRQKELSIDKFQPSLQCLILKRCLFNCHLYQVLTIERKTGTQQSYYKGTQDIHQGMQNLC